MLIGEVSRLPRVTAGDHISQMGGEVSSWVGYGVVETRLTHAMLREYMVRLTLEGSGVPYLTGIGDVGWVFL